ncbi:MAG: sulfite exporter TauE/SafE family protein [Aestuariivita sp.]|uniref:sulfite exporter TauE/SafE family protein n=1 Tax=Aestuariivita sp. TaxID=1872407 RepID=UPI003BB16DEB
MPDLFAQVSALPGLGWLISVAFLAGIVRGFCGFGTAMVYMPIATSIVGPFAALISMTIMDAIGPLPNLPRALRERHPGDMGRLLIGLVIALPLGVWTLGQLPTDVFRYAVSLISLTLLVLLASGYRYRGVLGTKTIVGTGMLGGFLGGSTGLPGPPVIMLYMASAHPAQVVRATLMIYLLVVDALLLALLWLFDRLEPEYIALGFMVTLPYLAGNILGAALFRPERETMYRAIAYGIIAGSAILSLPVWE